MPFCCPLIGKYDILSMGDFNRPYGEVNFVRNLWKNLNLKEEELNLEKQ